MAGTTNAAKVPGAGKKDGKVRRKRFTTAWGVECKMPATEFPRLARDGVVAEFDPVFDRDGKHAGWNITVSHPIADALAAADSALAVAIERDDTAGLWDDLIPTRHPGGMCILQIACPAAVIRAFVRQAKRNGFKVVADDPAETEGGAA